MNNKNQFMFFLMIAFLVFCWTGIGEVYADVVSDLKLEMNNSGSAVAIWTKKGGSEPRIEAALVSEGTWDLPVVISDALLASLSPEVSINESNDSVAVWKSIESGHYCVYASMRPAAGSWSVPVPISAADENVSNSLLVKMDDLGNIVVTWDSYIAGSTSRELRSATAVFAGSWNVPTTISN